MSTRRLYGLIGYPLSHSFSPGFFAEKFLREGIRDSEYRAFPLESIGEFPALLEREPNLRGLNVTIPYKQAILPYLHAVQKDAAAIGAVNTIKFTEQGLIGYNTDWTGFLQAIGPLLQNWSASEAGLLAAKGALVLGTGGSSKAVHYALQSIGYITKSVSRKAGPGIDFSYPELNKEILERYPVIVQCTPLGMFPDVLSRPEIPYEFLSSGNLLFDLVYNPLKTVFLIKGEERGAAAGNGLAMLYAQAEAAWAVWNPENGD